MRFVTVVTSFNPAEAQLLRSRLDAAEFTTNVAHELASLSMEGYAMAAGGIQVQVPEDQLDDARALLAAKDSPAA